MRFEAVFLYLYDVGRAVNTAILNRELTRRSFQSGKRSPASRRIDTPESLQLPAPLSIELGHHELDAREASSGGFDKVELCARIYDEGVIAVEVRAELLIELEELHTVRARAMEIEGERATIDSLAARHFRILKEGIAKYIDQDQFYYDNAESEDYHIFCLLDPVEDPSAFIEEHREYLAPFLLGENPEIRLHASQVETTLKTPFSFTANDIAIFDMDRAFIIADEGEFEDLLLIIEHANYQLLELRTLDKLLDRLLDDAERDVRAFQRGRQDKRIRRSLPLGGISQKLGNLQPLRLDALFILENLENSSRIIGDYYLEQIYGHLCGIFNTQGWKRNIERRLDILQSIYTLTKSDATERTMLLLEVMVVIMIGVEIVALFLPLGH